MASNKPYLSIIPIKSFSKGKSRLRETWPNNDDVIAILMEKMFINVVSSVKPYSDLAIITPDPNIYNKLKDLEIEYSFWDSSKDLNQSLTVAIDSLLRDFTSERWKKIIILMADLPLLTKNGYKAFLEQISHYDIGIIPADSKIQEDTGTSGLFFTGEYFQKLNLIFGENSFTKFLIQLKNINSSFLISKQSFGHDLDTFSDLQYFSKSHSDVLHRLMPDLVMNSINI